MSASPVSPKDAAHGTSDQKDTDQSTVDSSGDSGSSSDTSDSSTGSERSGPVANVDKENEPSSDDEGSDQNGAAALNSSNSQSEEVDSNDSSSTSGSSSDNGSSESFLSANVTLSATPAAERPHASRKVRDEPSTIGRKSKAKSTSPKKPSRRQRARSMNGSSSCSPTVVTPGKLMDRSCFPVAKSPTEVGSSKETPAENASLTVQAPDPQVDQLPIAAPEENSSSACHPRTDKGKLVDGQMEDPEGKATAGVDVESSDESERKAEKKARKKARKKAKAQKQKEKAKASKVHNSTKSTKYTIKAERTDKSGQKKEGSVVNKPAQVKNASKTSAVIKSSKTPVKPRDKGKATKETKKESSDERGELSSSDDEPCCSSRIGKISESRRIQRLAMSRAKQLGVIKDGAIQAAKITDALKLVDSAEFKASPTHAYRRFYSVPGTRLPHMRGYIRQFELKYGNFARAVAKLHLTLARNRATEKAQMIQPDESNSTWPIWQFNNDLQRSVPSTTQVIHQPPPTYVDSESEVEDRKRKAMDSPKKAKKAKRVKTSKTEAKVGKSRSTGKGTHKKSEVKKDKKDKKDKKVKKDKKDKKDKKAKKP